MMCLEQRDIVVFVLIYKFLITITWNYIVFHYFGSYNLTSYVLTYIRWSGNFMSHS